MLLIVSSVQYVCGPFRPTSLMDAKKRELLEQALKLFMRLGIKSMTMDEVATQLRVSKKTLYEHFTDKNDLVEQAVAITCDLHRDAITGICERGLNAIDENEEIMRFVVAQIGQMHPSVQFDLQKYHPRAWEIMEQREREDIYSCVATNLRKGVAEGLYREDLDVEVITRLYLARIDSTWDGRVFPPERFSLPDVLWKHLEYHIRGIASKKGIAYLEKKAKNQRA